MCALDGQFFSIETLRNPVSFDKFARFSGNEFTQQFANGRGTGTIMRNLVIFTL